MATELIAAGDFVKRNGQTCVVTEVVPCVLGWKIYKLINLDTRAELCAPLHQLTRMNSADMDMMEVTEGDMVSIETPQEMFVDDEPKATTEVNDRWANVDPRQLDELAKNSTSKSTQNQTKWALQISCVKFVTDFPSVYDSCQILFLFCNLADPGTWLATGLLIGGKPGQQVATRSKTPTI